VLWHRIVTNVVIDASAADCKTSVTDSYVTDSYGSLAVSQLTLRKTRKKQDPQNRISFLEAHLVHDKITLRLSAAINLCPN